MDRTASPSRDFYRFAAGSWIDRNPVPADKSRWGGFSELREYNFGLLRSILEDCARDRRSKRGTPTQQVGDLFASAVDLPTRDRLGLAPLAPALAELDRARDLRGWAHRLADLEQIGGDGPFGSYVAADRRDSSTYALYLVQGGLSLPDREYYLRQPFAEVRARYRAHVAAMLARLGGSRAAAERAADTVLAMETALARAGRSQTALRDEERNYHRFTLARLERLCPTFPWRAYFARRGIRRLDPLVVGQPEFFRALDRLLKDRPLSDWVTYLRWQALRRAAPYLSRSIERASFAFFHSVLLGQRKEEPDWRRAAVEVDRALGEALGQLYVERHFPPEARARALELVERLEAVFRDRIARLEWMTDATRRRALAKFARFTTKIGHPERYRDYRKVAIERRDYYGNIARATRFEIDRRLGRVGRPVDRAEWQMTPPEVNAYFNPSQNEIVFPAGILQPPFFDVRADDALNYGAIGAVIGHEITHGYDDQGRKFDADGNLKNWWTPRDRREFNRRAKRIVDQYGAYEALPRTFVNGRLTMGENIADLGGVSLAFEALERRLADRPEERRPIDGLSPEQRFFLSYAQLWRENIREPDLRRRLTIDPHSPGRFRAVGPLANLPAFAEAFAVPAGSRMRRDDAVRVAIW